MSALAVFAATSRADVVTALGIFASGLAAGFAVGYTVGAGHVRLRHGRRTP